VITTWFLDESSFLCERMAAQKEKVACPAIQLTHG
jgi:hypothetical protein